MASVLLPAYRMDILSLLVRILERERERERVRPTDRDRQTDTHTDRQR